MIHKSHVFTFMLVLAAVLPGCSTTINQTATSTPMLSITPQVSLEDGISMVFVPAGDFIMGMDAQEAVSICSQFYYPCTVDMFTNAEPVHTVSLDAYWIGQTEVTNGMYQKCVSAGVCQELPTGTTKRPNYSTNPQYAEYPVVYVSWDAAKTYCTWAHARLPSEAEWEKAARGPNAYVYPWGNNDKSCSLVNNGRWGFNGCMEDTTAVGSYPAGASPYGALDMAGNVQEWVNDWYGETYYSQSPANNPQGPSSGDYRVLRGGTYFDYVFGIFTTSRIPYYPAPGAPEWVGFRCARSAP